MPLTISAIDLNGDGMTDLSYTGGRLSPAIGLATAAGASKLPGDNSLGNYLQKVEDYK